MILVHTTKAPEMGFCAPSDVEAVNHYLRYGPYGTKHLELTETDWVNLKRYGLLVWGQGEYSLVIHYKAPEIRKDKLTPNDIGAGLLEGYSYTVYTGVKQLYATAFPSPALFSQETLERFSDVPTLVAAMLKIIPADQWFELPPKYNTGAR